MHRVTRIRVNNELLLINLCSLVLILVVSFVDIQALRIVLGLPFLLFFPGYTLMATLFPKRSDIGATERVALSITFSVIITPVVGFVLNFLWRIDLYPILVALTIFIAAMSAVAWHRRRRVAPEDRLDVILNLPLSGGGRLGALDRVVSALLVMVFLGAVATLGYVITNPNEGERFTEFYILGAESRPTEITVGDAGIVTFGIINREHETLSYRMEVSIGGSPLETTDSIELAHGQKWEGEISFVPNDVCGKTVLTQNIAATDNSSQAEVKSLQVASVEHLSPGDNIWIGQYSAVVQEVTGNTVMLTEALKPTENQAAGTEVIEVQRVEFKLIKTRSLGEAGETSLSLWVGKNHLKAGVLNQGDSEAAYQMRFTIGVTQQTEDVRFDSAVQVVAMGDLWTQEVDYDFSENHEIVFSLYKDGELLYQRLESGGYPSLFLWIHVKAE
jgi:uncharacterized membrane protein